MLLLPIVAMNSPSPLRSSRPEMRSDVLLSIRRYTESSSADDISQIADCTASANSSNTLLRQLTEAR